MKRQVLQSIINDHPANHIHRLSIELNTVGHGLDRVRSWGIYDGVYCIAECRYYQYAVRELIKATDYLNAGGWLYEIKWTASVRKQNGTEEKICCDCLKKTTEWCEDEHGKIICEACGQHFPIDKEGTIFSSSIDEELTEMAKAKWKSNPEHTGLSSTMCIACDTEHSEYTKDGAELCPKCYDSINDRAKESGTQYILHKLVKHTDGSITDSVGVGLTKDYALMLLITKPKATYVSDFVYVNKYKTLGEAIMAWSSQVNLFKRGE